MKGRIRLGPGRLDVAPNGVAYQADGAPTRIALPLEARAAVEILLASPRGVTVGELVRQVHARTGAVSFRALGAALQALRAAGALVDVDGGAPAAAGQGGGRSVREQLARALSWRVPLFGRVERRDRAAQGAFFALAAIAGAAGAWCARDALARKLLDAPLFLLGGRYAGGLVLAWVGGSALRSLQHALKAVLLYRAQGVVPGGALRVTPLGVSFDVADEDFYAASRPGPATLYALASVGALPLFARAAALVLPADWGRQLGALALLMALWGLSPYGGGELRRLARAFLRHDLEGAELPYLKTQALANTLTKKTSADEDRLLGFASAALAWSVLGLVVVARLLVANASSVAQGLLGANGAGLFGAALVATGVLVSGAFLVLDLASTLAQNAVSPLAGRVKRALRTMRARDEATDVAAVDAALLEDPLFRECGSATRAKLAAGGRMRAYPAGAPIVVQGEVGRELFVLTAGSVVVNRKDEFGRTRRVAGLRAPCAFGELAVLKDVPRTADVVAETEAKVLVLAGASFKALLADPAHAADLAGCVDRIVLEQYVASSPAFRAVPGEVLPVLLARGEFVTYADGAMVFEQGGPGDAFFLVLRGEVEVLVDGASIAAVGQGSFVGEMALLSSHPRSATVRAKGEARLLRLGADDFWAIVSQNLELAMFLEATAEDRGRATRMSLASARPGARA